MPVRGAGSRGGGRGRGGRKGGRGGAQDPLAQDHPDVNDEDILELGAYLGERYYFESFFTPFAPNPKHVEEKHKNK